MTKTKRKPRRRFRDSSEWTFKNGEPARAPIVSRNVLKNAARCKRIINNSKRSEHNATHAAALWSTREVIAVAVKLFLEHSENVYGPKEKNGH